MKSGPSFQHFHKKSHQKCHAILPHSINKLLYVSKMCSHDDIPNAFLQVNNALD